MQGRHFLRIRESNPGLLTVSILGLSLALALFHQLIEIIGEAANNVSDSRQAKYNKIPWRQIIGMRNRIIYAYFEVDLGFEFINQISKCLFVLI
jgi:hypothetical protein